MYIPKKLIRDFFDDINRFGIRYVLIKNIGHELPEKLENGKDIDILVHIDDKDIFARQMSQHGFHIHTHPLGIEHGWTFAYGLPEYQFWQKNDTEYELYIDATFKLCCKSFTPYVWIPLDKKINKAIWETRVWDEVNHWWIMDEHTEIVYLLIRCIFDKRSFSAAYIQEIESRKQLLYDEQAIEKMRLIFFQFTDALISLIQQGEYENILRKYITFANY